MARASSAIAPDAPNIDINATPKVQQQMREAIDERYDNELVLKA